MWEALNRFPVGDNGKIPPLTMTSKQTQQFSSKRSIPQDSFQSYPSWNPPMPPCTPPPKKNPMQKYCMHRLRYMKAHTLFSLTFTDVHPAKKLFGNGE
jgi:hypothetical protein